MACLCKCKLRLLGLDFCRLVLHKWGTGGIAVDFASIRIFDDPEPFLIGGRCKVALISANDTDFDDAQPSYERYSYG